MTHPPFVWRMVNRLRRWAEGPDEPDLVPRLRAVFHQKPTTLCTTKVQWRVQFRRGKALSQLRRV